MMGLGVGAASEVTLTLEGITADSLPNNAMDVYVAGNYAYVADYTNGLVIVDISDPTNPTTVGNYPSRFVDGYGTAAAIGVAVSGNYAYVTNWYDDLYIIDVTDKTNPILANTYSINGGADSITISGDLAFIAADFDGVDIIDISNPINPVFLANYNTNDLAEGVAIQNNYAYIADRFDGVIIVDISDPANPSFVGSIDTPNDANSIVVSGAYAYVADADDTLIIDISNPVAPAIVGQYDTTASWSIAHDGNYVYVGDGINGVVVLNVDDPTTPVLAGSFDTAGFAGGLDIVGNLVYVADGPLVILHTETSVTSAPPDDMKLTYIGNYSMSNIIDLKVSDNYLYATNGSNFNVFNINSNGLLNHVYTIENLIGDIAIYEDYAYIAGANLTIVDITNPESPFIVGNYLGVGGNPIVVSGDYAYVAKYRNDLLVFDISDKTNPLLIGSCYVRQISDIAVSGNYVYTTDYDNLVLIDVSDPTSPSVVKSYSLSGAPRSLAFSNNYIYLPSFFYGLVVFDANDPLSAFISGVNEIPVNAHHIAVSGNYAYIANSPDGASLSQVNDVTVINVSNPSAPLYVGNYTKGPSTSGMGSIWDLAVSGDYIYVNDVVDGLVVLHIGAMTTAPVHNINKGTDFTTIQAAIDDASPGDEIHVDSGTYYENIRIESPIILRGIDTGDGLPVINAGDEDFSIGIVIEADYVTIDGFNITNSGFAGIIIAGNNNKILNNVLQFRRFWGILLDSNNSIVDNNRIICNQWGGNEANETGGIWILNGHFNNITNNSVSNGLWGISDESITFGFAPPVSISVGNLILSNNTISNSNIGIALFESNQNHIENNYIYNSIENIAYGITGTGVLLFGSNDSIIKSNLITGNEKHGIALSQSYWNILYENNIENNLFGVVLEESNDNKFYHNNLNNTVLNAVEDVCNNIWDDGYPSGGNFWNDYVGIDQYSGPNQNEPDYDGIGDTSHPIPELTNGILSSVDRYPLMAPYSPPSSDYEGKLLRQTGDFKVYLIEDGKKLHFTSPEALEWNGYSFDDVIEVSVDVINLFEPGADISITQAIIDKYHALGGAATFGPPAGTGEQTGYPDNAGVICTYVNFQNGAIEYFTNGYQVGNTYAILNPFFNKWASMGYGNSVLGYPISDMSDIQTSKFGTEFRYQHFKNGTELGSLEYNLATGVVYEIHGAIYATWSALGYADSILGLVTSDERDALPSFKGTTGRVSDFENGHLHWHSSGDHAGITYMTYGNLDALYVSMGGTDSWLGFSVMHQEDRGGYEYCEFEGGYIEWDVVNGVYKSKKFGITDGLVAEWHFDEGSGNVLGDSSGNGNDGTIYGATWTTDGKFASALQFDGNDYIVIPDSPELSGGAGKNMTVEYWFNTNSQNGYIISKIKDVSYKDWSTLLGGFGPGLDFWYENRGYDRRFYSGSAIEEGVWHHGAFTFQRSTSGSNAILKMYLDGNELPLTPFYQDRVPSNQLYDMPDTSAPVSIGYAGTYYGDGYFNGKIDEIRVFDRVLTAEDIKSEYERGGLDNQIVISELLPEHDSYLGSTSTQFSWRTNLESSSDLFIKQQDETSYSHYTGNAGTFHSITADNLLRNTWYDFYVSSGSKESEVRSIYVDNGIEFTQKSYNFNIERDYSQQATVTVQNTDSEPHSLLVSLNNPYDNLIVGFIGDGSQDREITLDPGESRDVTLSIFAQDAMLSQYQLQIDLNSIDSNVNDHAVVNLNVRQPNVDFSVTEIGADPYTLTKTFQVTNNGDRITDFSIFAEDGLEDGVLFKPAIIHANVGTGESLTFKLVPLLESDTPITGFINATGAGHYEKIAVDFSQSGDKSLFTSVLSDVTICMGTNSWYCTNRPNIKNTLSIPPGFDSSDVEAAVLVIDFSLPWSESSYRNHNVDISLNGHLVKSLNGVVPNGLYLIPIDPSFLNYGSGGLGVNQIDISTTHLNGGHYVVATNIEFRLKLNQLTTKLFADSQEEADNVVKSLDILCDKCVPKTEIISVESSPAQLEALAGQDITFDVNVNLKNIQDGALEVDVFKGDSLVAKSFRDVAGSPETTETFAISFQAPDNAGSHEYKILTRFREGASGELIDDSFCDVRQQSSYRIILTIPDITPPINKILFQSMRDGNEDIYVMDEDGGNQIRLTQNTAIDAYPVWSPDNQKIAFVSNRNGDWEIFSMNTDGNLQTNLSRNPANDGYISWSPDSQKIVFASNRDSSIPDLLDIYVMNADGNNVLRLTDHPAVDVHPAWSPNGQKIAFASDREGNREIYVMNTDGTNIINLTNYGVAYDDYPAWSPDGTKIAFASNRDSLGTDNLDIYVVNIDGSNVIRLTSNTFDDRHPAWSSDGSKIAFVSNRDGNREIYVMKSDGTEFVRLTNQLGDDQHPSFSPATSEPTLPTITITSPNGGEEWQAGTTQPIQWGYTGNLGPDVEIEIFNSSGSVQIFTYVPIGSDGSGSYSWTIPENIASGTDYQVMITVIGSAYSDTSGYFTTSASSSGFTVGQGAPTPAIEQLFKDAYNRNGGVGVLGEPESDVYKAWGYWVQDFPGVPGIPGGVLMYNSIQNDVFYIHGAIWEKYYNYPNKAELGPVKEDEKDAAPSQQGTTGRYSKFETGTIHWISNENVGHPQNDQSFVTYGELDTFYTSMGGTYNNYLGFPVMNQTEVDGYGYCEFEGGYIEWDVSSGIYKTVIDLGEETERHKYEVRVSNIDDIGEIRVNGHLIARAEYPNGDSGWVDIHEPRGDNFIDFTVNNTGGDWTYKFEFRKDGGENIWEDSCGEAGVPGKSCDQNTDTGIVYHKVLRFKNKAPVNVNVIFVKPDGYSGSEDDVGTYIQWLEEIKEYYKINSYGAINLNLSQSNNGNWYKLPEKISWYNNNAVYATFSDSMGHYYRYGISAPYTLARDTIEALDQITNYDDFDINLIIYKPNIKLSGLFVESYVDFGRAQAIPINYTTQTFDGKPDTARNWIIISSRDDKGKKTFAHELGHQMGSLHHLINPDLYQGGDVGNWDIMDNSFSYMSSFSKVWAGWLNYREETEFKDYEIYPLDSLNLGDEVIIFKPYSNNSNSAYYIFEYRRAIGFDQFLNNSQNKVNENNPNGVIVIYKVTNGRNIHGTENRLTNENEIDQYTVNILNNNDISAEDPSIYNEVRNISDLIYKREGLVANGFYYDEFKYLNFSEVKNPDGISAIINVKEEYIYNKKGAVIIPGNNIDSAYGSPSENINKPGLSLHAYSDDGKHVGMNYLTGKYEMQIPGARASGVQPNGHEWIIVPENVNVKYGVDSHANVIDSYEFIGIYSDVNGDSHSDAITQIIPPGVENEHLVTYSQNPDGSYLLDITKQYNITFLPPITNMDQFTLKDGSTLPIKFTARNSTTDEFIYDDTVNVTITNSTGHLITYFTNGTGTDSVRINSEEEQYIVNFHSKNYDLNVGEIYAVTVTFGGQDSLTGYEMTYFDLVEGGKAKGKDK